MDDYFDGNQWHTVYDVDLYLLDSRVVEYRCLSGTGGKGQLLDKFHHQQRAYLQPRVDLMVHYQKPDNLTPPEQQAELFCDTLGHCRPNEGVLFDIEGDVGFDVNDVGRVQEFTSRWLAVTEDRLERRSQVYVPSALKNSLTPAFLGDRIIKAPHYSRTPDWPHDVHQYGTRAVFRGVKEPGDGNRTALTLAEMKRRMGMDVATIDWDYPIQLLRGK